MHLEFTEKMVRKNINFSFHQFFEHGDLPHLSIQFFKLLTSIHEISMEGSMSQNVDLGPSFDFMKCRNYIEKKSF